MSASSIRGVMKAGASSHDMAFHTVMPEKKRFDYIATAKTLSLIGVVLFHCSLFYTQNPFFPESAGFSSQPVVVLCVLFDAILIASFVLRSSSFLPR